MEIQKDKLVSKWSNGEIQFIMKFNNHGNAHGKLISYYIDGSLNRISNYQNGILEGESILFDRDEEDFIKIHTKKEINLFMNE